MISWTGLAPWEFASPFPGSLTSTFPKQSYTELPFYLSEDDKSSAVSEVRRIDWCITQL